MNQVTIFGDIHANLPALEATLADMDARGFTNRYCLGDLVGYGTFPNEVVAAIRELGIPTLMGNYDQGVGNDSDDCGCAYKDPVSEALGKRSIAWSNAHTTADNKWRTAVDVVRPCLLLPVQRQQRRGPMLDRAASSAAAIRQRAGSTRARLHS